MEVDTTKQTLTINKLVSTKNENVIIEGDMIVPDVKPDILKTINSVGNVCIYKKEVLDGKIRFDGGINVYLIYLADSEGDVTRGLNTTLDFTQIVDIDECKSNMNIVNNMIIKNIECKVLNGRKINIKAEIEIQIQVYSNENVEILKAVNNINNIQTLNNSMPISTLIGIGNTKVYAKDTIAYDQTSNLSEILKADINIINKEVKTSYNKVLVKSDANVKLMYLTEDGSVKIINSNIPIMGFVDIADVTDNNLINTNYEIRNILIKPNGGEQHSVYIEIEVGITCMAYGISEIQLIEDMYSTDLDMNFTTKCIETEIDKCNKRDICNIEEEILIPEISNNQIYDVEIKPIINKVNILNQRVVYEGNINLNFLYASNTTVGIESKNYVLPFNYELQDNNINSEKKIITQIECIGDNFVILSDGKIQCKINLQFELDISNSRKINLIDEINIVESRNNQNCSMIIYLVKAGDTLWNIAKRYKTTVESIMELNNLENDIINVGEKLYIQRYKNKMLEVTA